MENEITNSVYEDSINDVEELLVNGADPNARETDNSTPLHYAQNALMTRLLLSHGADPYKTNDDGYAAIDLDEQGVINEWEAREWDFDVDDGLAIESLPDPYEESDLTELLAMEW